MIFGVRCRIGRELPLDDRLVRPCSADGDHKSNHSPGSCARDFILADSIQPLRQTNTSAIYAHETAIR